jgi:hypothetical protein
VYWISESARRLLRYEAQMQEIGSAEVTDPDAWTLPAIPAAPPVTEPPADPLPLQGTLAQYALDRPAPLATEAAIELYRAQAIKEGKNYPCRNEDCYHTAFAPGDPCPVCADKGYKSLFDGSDAA